MRVYSPMAGGTRLTGQDVTMDGAVVTANACMARPPAAYPNAATAWLELLDTDGTAMIDGSHKKIINNTSEHDVHFPLSPMPASTRQTVTPSRWSARPTNPLRQSSTTPT